MGYRVCGRGTVGLRVRAIVVVFDFEAGIVCCKCNALTTRWYFSVGIRRALVGLYKDLLQAAQLVSGSTTLAANALIENDGQKVGLFLIRPAGVLAGCGRINSPQEVLPAALDITGRELVPELLFPLL